MLTSINFKSHVVFLLNYIEMLAVYAADKKTSNISYVITAKWD